MGKTEPARQVQDTEAAVNIYLVSREDSAELDQLYSVVVLAPTAADARQFAALAHGDEGYAAWGTGKATVRHLGITLEDDTAIGVVCANFRAG